MAVLIDTEPGDGGEAPDTTPVTEPAAPPAAPSAPTHAGPDRIELESQTPPELSAHLVAAFGELIDSAEAPNHVEMRLTDRRVEAWHWGCFAAEMAGADEVFVYRVAPHTPPVPLEVPEQHPDGSDYAEFTCAAAMGLEVLEVLEVLEAGPARTGPDRHGWVLGAIS